MPKLTWDESFAELEEYFHKHGHSKVPSRYPRLGMWVVNQRNSDSLSQEQRDRLDAVNFVWETKEQQFERQWNEMFDRLQQYRRERLGTSMAERGYFNDDQELKRWVQTQQTKYRDNTIREDRKRRLEDVGFLWVRAPNLVGLDREWKKHDDAWEVNFEMLTLFKETNGHTMVPPDYEDEGLHKWVHRQRVSYKSKTLRDDRKERLIDLGFVWDMTDHCNAETNLKQRHWDAMFERLEAFKEEHGHTRCGKGHSDRELANWVFIQRSELKSGTLDDRRAQRLKDLGFTLDINQDHWEANYEKLVAFHQEHGHCLVPHDHELGSWIHKQRSAKRGVKNSGLLTPERIDALDEIDFVWNALEEKWSKLFSRLVDYKNEHGDCNVPDKYEQDKELGNWVKRQRSLVRGSKAGGLEAEKKKLLDDIGFVWLGIENWNEKYAKLLDFYNQQKHCDVPFHHKGLGRWVSYQRKLKAQGTLAQEAKLNSINFVWETEDERKDRAWNESFEKLAEYHKKHHTFTVPRSTPEGKKLYKWVTRQRESEKNGKLRSDRKRKLDGIGFSFGSQKTTEKSHGKKRKRT